MSTVILMNSAVSQSLRRGVGSLRGPTVGWSAKQPTSSLGEVQEERMQLQAN